MVMVLRETGVLDLNYYKATSKSEIRFNWKDNTIISTTDKSVVHTAVTDQKFSDLSIAVIDGSDTLYKEGRNSLPLIIRVDNLTTGFLWTPLYKSAPFVVEAKCSFFRPLTKTNAKQLSLISPKLNGHLTTTGEISISGFCSHRQAIRIIKNIAASAFANQTKQYCNSLEVKYGM